VPFGCSVCELLIELFGLELFEAYCLWISALYQPGASVKPVMFICSPALNVSWSVVSFGVSDGENSNNATASIFRNYFIGYFIEKVESLLDFFDLCKLVIANWFL